MTPRTRSTTLAGAQLVATWSDLSSRVYRCFSVPFIQCPSRVTVITIFTGNLSHWRIAVRGGFAVSTIITGRWSVEGPAPLNHKKIHNPYIVLTITYNKIQKIHYNTIKSHWCHSSWPSQWVYTMLCLEVRFESTANQFFHIRISDPQSSSKNSRIRQSRFSEIPLIINFLESFTWLPLSNWMIERLFRFCREDHNFFNKITGCRLPY